MYDLMFVSALLECSTEQIRSYLDALGPLLLEDHMDREPGQRLLVDQHAFRLIRTLNTLLTESVDKSLPPHYWN